VRREAVVGLHMVMLLCHVAIAVLLSSTKEKAGSDRVFLSVCVLKLVSKPLVLV
jgi:hypothetical protein